MAQQEEIILDFKINAEDTSKQLALVTQQIDTLKEKQKLLTKAIKEGNDEDGKKAERVAQLQKEISALTAQQKSLTGQLQTQYKVQANLTGSFREMDAQLRMLENQYKALTKVQRESAEGEALKKAIQEQKQALKDFDAELGNHQRNVGNYPQAWASVVPGLGKVQSVVQSLGADMGTLSQQGLKAFSGLGQSVKAFGKVFLTPPVAVIAAVVGAMVWAFQRLREAFQRNDDASTKLQAAFAKLQPIGDAIGIMFNKLADVVAGLVDKMMKAYEWVIKFGNRLGIVSDEFVEATAAAANLVRSVDELEQMERNYTVNSAKRSKEVAKLRNEAMSTDDLQERMRMLQKAIDLETETLAEAQAIARKRLQNLEAEANKIGDTSDETANKIAQARAAMYQAEEAYYTGTRRLLRELQSTEAEWRAKEREDTIAAIQAKKDEIDVVQQWLDDMKAKLPEIAKEEEEEFEIPLSRFDQLLNELMSRGMRRQEAMRTASKILANEVASDYADAAGQIAGSMGASFSAISDLLEAYGEENEEAAKAAKGFALVGIIASEAESVANGVKAMTAAIAGATAAGASTGIAAPITTPLFIAQMTAIVGGILATTIANIAQAKNILSGAKFATGGIVGGNSYSGDRVPAMVNSGEMILNRDQQQRLFEIANAQTAGGQYDMMQAAMTEALRAMPSPVLEYSEFGQFIKRVTTYKEIASV